MIQINLVIKRKSRFPWQKVALAAASLAAAAGLTVYAQAWWAEYQLVREELQRVTALTESYRKVTAQSGKIKEQEAQLQRQESRLEAMARNQSPTGQSEVLTAVLRAASAITLTELSVSQNGHLTVTGRAPSAEAALAYLATLRQLPELAGVEERKLATAADGATFTYAARVRREETR